MILLPLVHSDDDDSDESPQQVIHNKKRKRRSNKVDDEDEPIFSSIEEELETYRSLLIPKAALRTLRDARNADFDEVTNK